jgi:hypothetical protein
MHERSIGRKRRQGNSSPQNTSNITVEDLEESEGDESQLLTLEE